MKSKTILQLILVFALMICVVLMSSCNKSASSPTSVLPSETKSEATTTSPAGTDLKTEIINEAIKANANYSTCKYTGDSTIRAEFSDGTKADNFPINMNLSGITDIPKKEMYLRMNIALNGESKTVAEAYTLNDLTYTNAGGIWTKMKLTEEMWQKEKIYQYAETLKTALLIKFLDPEIIDGIPCHVVEVEPNLASTNALMDEVLSNTDLENSNVVMKGSVKLWIAQDRHLITNADFEAVVEISNLAKSDNNEFERVTMTVNSKTKFYDYNLTTSITLPVEAKNAIELFVSPESTDSQRTAVDGRFAEMLRLILEMPGTRNSVLITDYARVRELYGISLPGPDANENTIKAYIDQLNQPALNLKLNQVSFISGLESVKSSRFGPQSSPIRRKNVGFGPQDVDMDLIAGIPPLTFEIAKGRFDPLRSEGAISDCVETPNEARKLYQTEVYRNITIHSWGDGLSVNFGNVLQPPAYDQLGRLQPMAVTKDYVFRIYSKNGIKTMIVFSLGDRSGTTLALGSLGLVDNYHSLAKAQEDLGAYTVLFSDKGQKLTDYQGKGMENSPLLNPYEALAIGIGKDDKGQYMTLALVHSSADLASSNVNILKERLEKTNSWIYGKPWATIIQSSEIRSEGKLLVAKIRGEALCAKWFECAKGLDPIVLQKTP